MSGLRGSAPDTLATPARLAVRPITLGLVALLVTAILAVAIVLAASGGDQAGATKSVRVTASAPLTPSPAERHQPPGLNGPGARP